MVDAASASAVRRVIVIDVPPGDVLLLLIVRSHAKKKAISLTGLFNGTNSARRGQAPICALQRNGKERDRGRVRRCPWRLVGGLGLEEDAPAAARRRA